ncbi:unnamed protein product [Strongylus vulgaris]|uniref:Reverse transcriptase domain-containing protein n=1 Tax=Strongylus vulgaris TaxID=40348 RepID=A0A3P7LFW1_STRVU|nr:unnamed protein product [Strongylus vulgaris]
MPRTRNLERIPKATKDLLERRRTLRPDPTATHLERLTGLAQLPDKDGTYHHALQHPCQTPLFSLEKPLRLPAEVRATIQTMKAATALGPEEVQPVAQAGYRQGFTCVDHIHTDNRGLPRVPVETNTILSALVDREVYPSYVRTWPTAAGTALQGTAFPSFLNIPISKGVRQGDTVTPKLFTAALQWVVKSLNERESTS